MLPAPSERTGVTRPDSSRQGSHPRHVVACFLGRLRYEPAWDLQKEIQARIIAAKRADPPVAVPNVMLLVEHPPVYTLGKSGDDTNLVWDEARRSREGVEFHRIDRGGDVTFHGPGQLVGYPILDLDRFFTDIHRYLRTLEEAVIATVAHAGVAATRMEGRTGVWVGPDARGPERKICAMGVRCSRWVTMHGFALNVEPRMHFYDGIIPCGIQDRGVTSLALETGRPGDLAGVARRFAGEFAQAFLAEVEILNTAEGWAFLSELLDRPLEPANYTETA